MKIRTFNIRKINLARKCRCAVDRSEFACMQEERGRRDTHRLYNLFIQTDVGILEERVRAEEILEEEGRAEERERDEREGKVGKRCREIREIRGDSEGRI
eukprot:217252-Amorphochlora_amoeboformis.AAC.1